MNKNNPRKSIRQPELPDLGSVPSYWGQPIVPSTKSDKSLDRLQELFNPSGDIDPSGGKSVDGFGKGGSHTQSEIEGIINKLLTGGPFSQNIGNAGSLGTNNELINQLLQLALGNMNIDGTYSTDIQKKYLEMILDNLTKQEQRSFDTATLQEQRSYDHPLSQILRLMSTGMSRDAALQAIQGTSEVPLVGSGSEVDSGADLPSPTQTALQGMQTGLGLLQTFGSLISLGFSIPQAISQASILKTQSLLSKKQLAAFDASATAYGILNNAGVAITDETFGNIANVSKVMSDLASSGNAAASAFIHSGGVQTLSDNAPYSLPFLNQMYRNHRDPSDYRKQFDLQIGNEEARLNLTEVTTSKMLVEMTAIQDTVNNLRAQTGYYNALSALTGSQKRAQDLQNQLDASWRSDDGLTAYRDSVINGLIFEGKKLAHMNSTELWREQVETMLKNEEYAQVSLDLATLYSRGELGSFNSASEDTQALLSFCRAMQSNGYFDYIKTKVDANTKGSWRFGPAGGSSSAVNAWDEGHNLLYHPSLR